MKTLENTFNKIKKANCYHSTIVCFIKTIRNKNYCPRVIKYHFNRLVEKDDYSQKDKRNILKSLYALTKPET